MSDIPRTDAGKGLGRDCATCVSCELCADLERENADLRRQLAEARDKALEDAAEMCEQHQGSAENCAAAIRQLKGKQS